jgi:hypothetical protein
MIKLRPFFDRSGVTRFRRWSRNHSGILLAVVLALSIALFFYGRHIGDAMIPPEGDVRAHIFKIEIVHNYLSHLSWPKWVPYWYQGIPMDQYYPPGFYFLGAIFTFILGSSVIAYKLLLLLALMLNGLTIYYFARRFLQFDPHLSLWALLAFEASAPLLVNFVSGEGPNLLGWSANIMFLTVYLSQITENKIQRVRHFVWPGLLLGVAILIHPFPVIFAIMAVVLFHIVWLAHNRNLRFFVRYQIPFIAGVGIIGGLIGAYYWLPAALTLHYSSPIYAFTRFMWPGGNRYLLAMVILALVIAIAARFKIRGNVKFDFVFVSFALASILGFGGTYYLPFGLGSLVQEFRFAAIVVPFFVILLILFPLKYRIIHMNWLKLTIALAAGIVVTAVVFGLDKESALVSGFKALSRVSFKGLYNLLASIFVTDFPGFIITVLPYTVILLFLSLSLGWKMRENGNRSPAFILAGGACLMLLTSFIPYINTDKQVNFSRLYNYVDHYQTAAYAQIMEAVTDSRLIVPPSRGFLSEGDSPVTFGQRWGIETVNGPYNQGDPKFFKFTVHLEWGDRWLDYQYTRENLMQESAAKNIFVRDSYALPREMAGLNQKAANFYGKILELDENIDRAVKVTPILLDAQNPNLFNEFFNILLPTGYKLVMVDIKDVHNGLSDKFTYVMVDNASKVSQYPGKTVFVVNNSGIISATENTDAIYLNVPYQNYTKQLFYQGNEANANMWTGWDGWPGARPDASQQATLNNAGQIISKYLNQLDYTPVEYKLTNNRIDLSTSPGFTLVKDSYFPYWTSRNSNIMSTSQGFILVYSDADNIVLNFQRPGYYKLATIATITVLIAAIVWFLGLSYSLLRRHRKSLR